MHESCQGSPIFFTSYPLSARAPGPLIVPQFLHVQTKVIDLVDPNSEALDTLVKRETRQIQSQSTNASDSF